MPIWLWGLATAEVAQGPGSVAEHTQLAAVTEKGQQWLESTARQDIVAACWGVTSNVTESPDGLFADIWLVAAEKLDEDWDGTSLDDDLGLLSRARSNVGQSPRSLELNKSVRGTEELDEAADNAGLDDLLDRWVSLLRKELSELGGGLNLKIDLVGQNAGNHLWKILVQLKSNTC